MSWGDCHCHMILKVLRLWFNCKLWCWLIANFDVIIVISCFDVITCLIASFDVAKFCDISCWEMNFPLEYAHDMPTCLTWLSQTASSVQFPREWWWFSKGNPLPKCLEHFKPFFFGSPGNFRNTSPQCFRCWFRVFTSSLKGFCSTRTSWAPTVPVASKGP